MSDRKVQFHGRLAVQLGLAVALVTGLGFATLGGFVVARERETLTREYTLRLLAEIRSLSLAAANPLLRHDPELELHPFVLKALAEAPDLVDVVVLDAEGRIQGHRDLQRVDTPYTAARARSAILLPHADGGERAWLEDGDVVIEHPIAHLGRRIGTLVARASRAGIEATVAKAQQQLIVLGTLGTLVAIAVVLALVSLHLRALAALRSGVLRLGGGELSARVHVRARNELGLFADLVNSMASGLEKAQSKLIQKERLDRELEIARELQAMLLPHTSHTPGGYHVAAHYVPALEVSGDYYDVLRLDERHLGLVTADVSGKGVPGLVVMSMLRTALHALASSDKDPKQVLVEAARMLQGSMRPGTFVTCVYGVLDTHRHRFRYASAGHCPPGRFGPSGTTWLPAGGKPLGLFPEAIFERSLHVRQADLAAGDGLLLYTDGLVEAMDANGVQLGCEPVLAHLTQAVASEPRRVVHDLLQRVDRHRGERPHSDDLTLIVVRRTPSRVEASA